MKIAFVKNDKITNLAEFYELPVNIQDFVESNDADSYLLESDSKVSNPNNFIIDSYFEESVGQFIRNKPFESWNLSEETFDWEAPTLKPAEGSYYWDEAELTWQVIDFSEIPAE